MVKIYQGEFPKTINVVVNRKVIATARFVNGVYETDNKEVIAELKRYGYEVESVKKEEPTEIIEEIKESKSEIKEESEVVKPKVKTKPKTNKKKGTK